MFGNTKAFPLNECRTGLDFENWVVAFLTSIGFNANRVGGADNGVDIVATYSTTSKKEYKFYIQCKYHNRPVGNTPIQEVYTGANYYGGDGQPVVITNNRVTANAKAYAKKMNVEIIDEFALNELNIALKSKKIINTSRDGLIGILLSHSVLDVDMLRHSIKKYSQQKKAELSDKELLKQELIETFDQAEIYEQEAERLSMEASKYRQQSISLQRQALLRNLDYG